MSSSFWPLKGSVPSLPQSPGVATAPEGLSAGAGTPGSRPGARGRAGARRRPSTTTSTSGDRSSAGPARGPTGARGGGRSGRGGSSRRGRPSPTPPPHPPASRPGLEALSALPRGEGREPAQGQTERGQTSRDSRTSTVCPRTSTCRSFRRVPAPLSRPVRSEVTET